MVECLLKEFGPELNVQLGSILAVYGFGKGI